MSSLLRWCYEFGQVFLALQLHCRLMVLLSDMELGWTAPELTSSSQMAFSAIQGAPEFLRGLVDMTRSKVHLCLWLNRAQVSAVLQWWTFARVIIRVSSPLLFQVWKMGDKSHQITGHTSGARVFDPDTHSSPPWLVTQRHTEPGAGVAVALGAALINSSRRYSPSYGASMLMR